MREGALPTPSHALLQRLLPPPTPPPAGMAHLLPGAPPERLGEALHPRPAGRGVRMEGVEPSRLEAAGA